VPGLRGAGPQLSVPALPWAADPGQIVRPVMRAFTDPYAFPRAKRPEAFRRAAGHHLPERA